MLRLITYTCELKLQASLISVGDYIASGARVVVWGFSCGIK